MEQFSTSVPSQVSVADVLRWSVPVQWHEAVAVVRQAALRVTSGEPAPVPTALTSRASRPAALEAANSSGLRWPPSEDDLDVIAIVDTNWIVPAAAGIWLTTDGTVELDAGEPGSEDTVRALSGLLRSLLPASAPPDLQLLADAGNPSIAKSSPQEFISALAFFARPDDVAEVRALVERALDARVASERAEALRTLTERARHGTTEEQESVVVRNGARYQQWAMAAAALVVAVMLAGMAAWWALPSEAAQSVAAQPVAATSVAAKAPAAPERVSPIQRVQQKLAAAATFVGEALGVIPAPPVAAAADVPRATPRRRSARSGESKALVLPTVEDGGETAPVPAVPEAPVGALPAPHLPLSAGVHDALAAASRGVYSRANLDVVPPAPVRTQMPAVPLQGVSVDRPGVLELMVDEQGQVLSAKLLPASNRHQDRMMISAAKTWRFSPAMRYGQPVTYRLLMPITW